MLSKSWRLQRDDPNAIHVNCPIEEKDAFETELNRDNHVVFLGSTFQGGLEVGGSWLVQGRILTVLWTRGPQEKDGKKVSKMTRDQGPPLPTADAIKLGKIKVPGIPEPPTPQPRAIEQPPEKPPEEKPQETPIPA